MFLALRMDRLVCLAADELDASVHHKLPVLILIWSMTAGERGDQTNQPLNNSVKLFPLMLTQNAISAVLLYALLYYLVRWLGYSPAEDSWEPEENLQGTKRLLDKIQGLMYEAMHRYQGATTEKMEVVNLQRWRKKKIIRAGEIPPWRGALY